MIQSTLAGVLVVALALVSSVHTQMQDGQMQGAQPNGLLGALQLDNLLGGGGNNRQGQQGLLGGLPNLGSLLGNQQQQQQPMGNQMNNQNNPMGGLGSLLQNLPRRSIEALNQILSSVRNLLPTGLGRNSQMQQQQQQQLLPLNLQGLNLQGLTAPLTEALSQGRLPNVNQLTQQLPGVANNLVPGLGRTISDVLPMNNNGPAVATDN